jgi:hypothetical protein
LVNGFTLYLVIRWREKRDSNPQPTVLETGALPVELFSQRNNLYVRRWIY